MKPAYDESGEIYKRDLRRFFDDLKQRAHHIYALLAGAPKSAFWIVLDRDDPHASELSFTIKEFYTALGRFRSGKDTFRVYFRAYFFRDERDACFPGWEVADPRFNGEEQFEICDTEELTAAEFEKEWPHLLAHLCREAILANAPMRLSRETIKRFGFSRADVDLLREPVAQCNWRAIAELREQYDRLAAIACLHEAPKANFSAHAGTEWHF